jgi:hypothetical protein
MGELTLAELRALAERDELLAHVVEQRLDELDCSGGAPYSSRAGVELNVAAFEDTDEGRAEWRRDFAARRRAYLEGRWRELSARAERRRRANAAAAQGIERFLGPGLTLEDIADMERERREVERGALERADTHQGAHHELSTTL